MPVLLTPSLVHQSFLQTIDAMEKHLDSFVLRPGRDFTRHRRLPLKDLVLLMMSMEKSTVEGEIHRFFSLRYPEHSILSRPSASAFIRQRAKLNDDFFPNLLKRFNTRFPFTKTKFGLHLLACDGTDNNIPADEDPDTFISYNSKDGGYYQFHSVALHDLLEKRYTDAVVQPRALMNENDALVTLVESGGTVLNGSKASIKAKQSETNISKIWYKERQKDSEKIWERGQRRKKAYRGKWKDEKGHSKANRQRGGQKGSGKRRQNVRANQTARELKCSAG